MFIDVRRSSSLHPFSRKFQSTCNIPISLRSIVILPSNKALVPFKITDHDAECSLSLSLSLSSPSPAHFSLKTGQRNATCMYGPATIATGTNVLQPASYFTGHFYTNTEVMGLPARFVTRRSHCYLISLCPTIAYTLHMAEERKFKLQCLCRRELSCNYHNHSSSTPPHPLFCTNCCTMGAN